MPVVKIIDIKNLEFAYSAGKNLTPVTASHLTLKIDRFEMAVGEKVFLYGASGSGKTTLLEILAGILLPTKGEVVVAGESLMGLDESQRDHFRAKNLGYIFQSFNLLPYLTVRENILLPVYMGVNATKMTDAKKDLEHLSEKLSITEYLDRSSSQISVGQAQRVAVARALLARPKLILADEPTSSLDYDRRSQFLELLFGLCKEIQASVIFVSHDLSLKNLFDRSLLLSEINRVEMPRNELRV